MFDFSIYKAILSCYVIDDSFKRFFIYNLLKLSKFSLFLTNMRRFNKINILFVFNKKTFYFIPE